MESNTAVCFEPRATSPTFVPANTSKRSYWLFLSYFSVALTLIHVLIPPLSRSQYYVTFLGFAGLGVEALLPVPQIIENQRSRSCKGIRLSVIASWLIGDAMKMCYFFYSGSAVPLAFRVCGTFQCSCDCYLGLQFWLFGDSRLGRTEKAPATTNGNDGSERWGMKETDVRLS